MRDDGFPHRAMQLRERRSRPQQGEPTLETGEQGGMKLARRARGRAEADGPGEVRRIAVDDDAEIELDDIAIAGRLSGPPGVGTDRDIVPGRGEGGALPPRLVRDAVAIELRKSRPLDAGDHALEALL